MPPESLPIVELSQSHSQLMDMDFWILYHVCMEYKYSLYSHCTAMSRDMKLSQTVFPRASTNIFDKDQKEIVDG